MYYLAAMIHFSVYGFSNCSKKNKSRLFNIIISTKFLNCTIIDD